MTQKYLHDLTAWKAIGADRQEKIIGRTKVDNIELDDDAAARKPHKSLATIVDAQGVEHDILRDNMPFGSPGRREFGTYFIGYSRRLWVIEKMLERMFVGEPAGAYDRLLDFSTARTGTLFFVPSADFLDDPPPLPDTDSAAEEAAAEEVPDFTSHYNGTLAIGSLKGHSS